jgi:hypothetical protein
LLSLLLLLLLLTLSDVLLAIVIYTAAFELLHETRRDACVNQTPVDGRQRM